MKIHRMEVYQEIESIIHDLVLKEYSQEELREIMKLAAILKEKINK